MKDWLGNEYDVGDKILYPAQSGRSTTMVIAEVLEIKQNGNVKVMPIKAARWKQHHGRIRYIDTRTGKKIDPWSNEKHHKVKSHYIHRATGVPISPEEWDALPWHQRNFRDYERVNVEFHDYVQRIVEDIPVTLKITENITKWTQDV